jgi:hypothetical protein
MKCLSIRQPWALLVCVGTKRIENRSRNTLHRGEIAIHSGSSTVALKHFSEQNSWDESLQEWFTFGAIIGVAELYDAVPFDRRSHQDPWATGPFCLMFRNPRLFCNPIPHKGRVNLCELSADVAQLVYERKARSVDTVSNGLVERCARVFPAGKIPGNLLPRPSRSASQW